MDRNALVALYHSTGGADCWRNSENWDSEDDVSTWYGVKVDDEGRVVALHLGHNNLAGYIPKELGDLPKLQRLWLYSNKLTGSIPKELGSLTELREMSLFSNQLTGKIPEELGKLTALVWLKLGGNKLIGHIPKEMGAFRNTQKLWLYSNKLTGHIPKELGALSTLVLISLSKNQLSGPIPPEFGNLRALEYLHLERNQLGGPIPWELGNLVALKTLSLSQNQLSGLIPPQLGNLSALEELSLWGNKLSGRIPPQLQNLHALERLNLRENKFDGDIPKALGALSKLRELCLNANQLTGPIPTVLGSMTNLEVLSLSRNQLTGGIPSQLGNLSVLERLDFSRNMLDGPIAPELGNLTSLEILHLWKNQLSGHIPPQLGYLSTLESLNVNWNKLDGTIPKELGQLTGLASLQLQGNNLTGTIPKELGALSKLQKLWLNSNQLTGLWDCGASVEGGETHAEYQSGVGIPRELDDFLAFLGGLKSFKCGSNQWMEPPAAVLGERGNFSALRSYFLDLYREKRVVSRSLKVVLVGKESTGKTRSRWQTLPPTNSAQRIFHSNGMLSLRQSIAAGRAEPTEGPADSTVHLTIQDTTLGGVSVRILDCAGQVAYYGLLQLFLTRRAVYLLVWDASQEGCNETGATCTTDDLQTLGILPWLAALSFRLPGGDVILVGNKCDLRSCLWDSAAHAASRVESACRGWLARIRSSGGRAVEIERGTSLTSCAQPGWRAYLTSTALRVISRFSGYKMGWPCDWSVGAMDGNRPPSLVDRIVRTADGSVRAEEAVLPESWELALSFLRDLRDNERDDAAAAARDGPISKDWTRTVSHGMERSKLFLLWEDTLRERDHSVPNPTSALQGALVIREYEGTILSVGSFVFLDVVWLAKVLEPVLNHKGIEYRDGARVYGDMEVTEQWQEYSLLKLNDEGILEHRLAAVLWPGYAKHVLAALDRVDLTFPCPGSDDGGLVVPLRLPEARPLYVGQHLANFGDDQGQKSLTLHWKFPHGVPPGGIERIISRCSHIGAASLFWRFGVLVRVGTAVEEEDEEGNGGLARSWFMLEYDRYEQDLVIAVWGDLNNAAAWATLSYISAVVREMTLQYPGLIWQAFLGCPDHPGEAMCISEAQRSRDSLVAKEHICRQCRFAGKGAAFLASELLEADDIDGPPGVAFQRVMERISEVRSTRLNTGGTSNASSPQAQVCSIDDQAARQLEEISQRVLPEFSCPPDEDLKTWAANLRNLRFHCTREDVQHIVEESNKSVLEAAGKLLHALTNLGTRQSAGQRLLAREVAGLTARIPRHAVLLPPREDESLELSETEREASSWIRRLKDWRAHGKRAGKGVVSKEYRLFFLCGHDHSLAECGFEGKGYRIRCPREWVRKGGLPFMKALLIVVSVALKTFAGLSIPTDGIASVGGQAWDEVISSTVEGAVEASIEAGCSALGEKQVEGSAIMELDEARVGDAGHNVGEHSNASSPLPTPREATEMLERLVRDLSVKGLQNSSGGGRPSFLCFDTTMQLVDRAGQGEEWWWVRTKNVEAFTA